MAMNEIGMYLKKINNRLEKGKNCALKKYELTGTQLDVMEYVLFHEEEENTLSNLAAYFDVQHTSMIHVLKALEKKQYLYKMSAVGKQRKKRICLTEEGRQVVLSTLQGRDRVNQMMLGEMSEEDREKLKELLEKIYHNLETGQCRIQ